MSQPQPASTSVVLQPMGSPLPLGFLGLAAATTLVAALQLGWFPADQGSVVAWCLLGFTVPLQLVACLYGFRARDAVAGTGMGVLAGTWAAVAAATLTQPPGSTSQALGLMLVVAAVALAVPATAAWQGKRLAAAVIGLSAVRLAVSGAYHLSAGEAWKTTAGVLGVLLGGLAIYAALAFELEDTMGRAVLPTGRRGDGRNAFTGSLADQTDGIEHEAGVRKQL